MYNSQLKAFVAAAECGSFTKAAAKLFISPTAVMPDSLRERIS